MKNIKKENSKVVELRRKYDIKGDYSQYSDKQLEELEKQLEEARKGYVKFIKKQYRQAGVEVPNMKEATQVQLEELDNRLAEITYERKDPRAGEKGKFTFTQKHYESNLMDEDINTNKNFKLINTNTTVRRGFVEQSYYNADNYYVINLFIAIRYYLLQIAHLSSMVSVELEITFLDERSEEQITTRFNLSKAAIEALKAAKNVSDIYDIIRSFDEVGQGSDSEVSTLLFNPRKFKIGYKPKDVKGGSLTNAPNTNRKDCKIFEQEGFLCINTPNAKNNCLIECFRFYAHKPLNANKIRNLLGFNRDEMLALSNIPILEKYFDKKVCVITGYGEDRLNIIYGDKEKCDFGIMYFDSHFSVIRADANKLREEENKKIEEKRNRKLRLAAYWSSVKEEDPERYKIESEKWKVKSELTKPYRYIFFDFETVYDNKGVLYPYAVSVMVFSDSWEKVDDCFEYDEVGERRVKIRETLDNFLVKHDDPNYINLMISYNGARFDNFILSELLAQTGRLNGNNLQMANGNILRMRFMSYTVIDLCRFVMLPLKVACEGFKCADNKLEFDHTVVQRAQFEGKLGEWLSENKDKLKDYNDRDNIVLMQLFRKVKESIKKLTGQDIEKFMTISQMSYEHWRVDCDYKKVPPPLVEHVKETRKALIAGRSQAFMTGFFDFTGTLGLNSLDVKSLYPFVMEECLYPIGQEIETQVYMPEKLGIYCVHIISQPLTKIIPRREKGKPLDWAYEGEFDTVLTSIDIDVLREFNCEFEIIKFEGKDYVGFYWENNERIFADFVKVLREAKTQQDIWKDTKDENYNPALREIIKLYLNTPSGKVGQREYDNDISFCFTENQMQSFVSTHSEVVYNELPRMNCIKLEGFNNNYEYKAKSAKPVHIAAFIYSYARSHMYRAILSKTYDKFFTDTDSCHMREEMIQSLEDEGHGFGKFHIGGEFGDFEREISFKVARYYPVCPKNYAMFAERECDKKIHDRYCCKKLRFKGINQKSDKLFETFEIVDKDTVKEYRRDITKRFGKCECKDRCICKSDMFNLYETLEVACEENLYRSLTSNKAVAVLSGQIKRETGLKKIASLHQNFIIKTITPSGFIY